MRRVIRPGPGGGDVELFRSSEPNLPGAVFYDRRRPLGRPPPPLGARIGATVGRGGGGGGHGGGHGRGHGGARPRGPWSGWGSDLYYLTICQSGDVRLPDGTCIRAEDLDYDGETGTLVTLTGRVPRRLADHVSVGTILGPGGSSQPLGSGASTSGSQTSGNASADALNLQWIALDTFRSRHPDKIGASPVLPPLYSPGITDAGWASDYNDWQTFYADVPNWLPSWASLTGDITGWQAYANAWGAYFSSLVPNATDKPANYPTGTAGILPTIQSIMPGGLLSGLKNALSTAAWIAVAVVAGVGIWILWPVLMHFKG
jgi:hypothetical protein